ncbi:hypothetical protein [Amycolatopsis lexingtonensis]|uniref:hypothetical protein n=1 Tax=Amycolatopsis lexingtonensis TaxID=218822 RepID=UPI003F722C35
MSNPERLGGENTTYDLALTAQPDRTTAGGIVLLEAVLPAVPRTYDVSWTVTGPVVLTTEATRIALLGATSVAGDRVEVREGEHKLLRATLDTTPLAVGSWTVTLRLVPIGIENTDDELSADAGPIEVLQRPFAAGDDVAVTLKRAQVPPTEDQSLWVAIRNSTTAIGFENFSRFVDQVMCGDTPGQLSGRDRRALANVERRTALPFPNVNRYRLLKAATEVFLMVNCGVDRRVFDGVDVAEESRRLNRTVSKNDIEREFRDYLVQVDRGNGGGTLDVLPYLGLIRLQLRDVAVTGKANDDEDAEACFGILADKLVHPCFLELIWSFWTDEAGPLQALRAISWRFQNRAAGSPRRDPLATMDIDPLRPLNNLVWGWIQDEQHRLTMSRRAYEYDHAYGLELSTRQGPPVRGVDSRSRFLDAFHNLLSLCEVFYRCDDDTTVIADGFGMLNALKETHLLLTQGAHNQYGDLPWTARHEMLMAEWILARPELKDFLSTRTMVAYQEPWMDRVEAMNRLQHWTDVSVQHFRDLAVFGEQLLLSIRFAAWSVVINPENAAQWARYFRAEVKGYIYAYRAVSGVDLTRRDAAPAPVRERHGAYRS